MAADPAVVGNLVVYAVGRLAGGDFAFTRDGSTVHVDPSRWPPSPPYPSVSD